ncbi:class I SAM-dependent methyltransferase [Actinoplanes sp. M2I2]|uniref:SAM-dependent methyltransferase n=1 Tax=Actinoplanes sp. M2I2 TaxID=1734444 RepID=UPI00202122D7|nr:class I SAM-dependent methyltransferase [Actinoplanes sp. M2I2]
MPASASPRLRAIVHALPLRPHLRVLEIGCGPGVAARLVAARLDSGHILAIDRSAAAVAQARAGSAEEIAAGRLIVRQMAAEELVLSLGEDPYDLVFAVRVGALDGRHPALGERIMARLTDATRPGARLFVDGGDPLRELPLPR